MERCCGGGRGGAQRLATAHAADAAEGRRRLPPDAAHAPEAGKRRVRARRAGLERVWRGNSVEAGMVLRRGCELGVQG